MGCSGIETVHDAKSPKDEHIENDTGEKMKNNKKNLIENENEKNNKEDIKQSINEENDKNQKGKDIIKSSIKNSLVEYDNRIIVPPAQKEFVVEGNTEVEKKSYKKRSCKGLTILENVKEYLPETISREEIKSMVYNALGNSVVLDDSEYVKGKNFTKDQVEAIIDILFKTVTDNENIEQKDFEDEKLKDVKVKIGFYDANIENVRRIIFKGKNPTDEEVENMLNQITYNNETTKLLAVELED